MDTQLASLNTTEERIDSPLKAKDQSYERADTYDIQTDISAELSPK